MKCLTRGFTEARPNRFLQLWNGRGCYTPHVRGPNGKGQRQRRGKCNLYSDSLKAAEQENRAVTVEFDSIDARSSAGELGARSSRHRYKNRRRGSLHLENYVPETVDIGIRITDGAASGCLSSSHIFCRCAYRKALLNCRLAGKCVHLTTSTSYQNAA